eukprot:CAMPEP_0202853424 /NCGR_PEP_ID=MMETSP1389-20130828/90475_1 /ASSEMBLY_ACC=CAM_ASM_000865 /TAXON_ID=302021 /ORGANISM="Rhodomonas sp., Strain CCMP768" /LENGTH=710 /DNA_ID=CAMNT_0049531973 /DNA_START=39 /DNA_END=2172 /DNA_ORIENTATION=+
MVRLLASCVAAVCVLTVSSAFQLHSSFIPTSLRQAAISRMPSLRTRSFSPRMNSGITTGEVHGEGGAYVAGYWVPYDDCAEQFNIKGGSGEKVPAGPCPRSRTRHSAAKADGTYDVCIIGSGAIGAAIARELSKTTASVIMVEAGDDVSQGATKGNSGIVHAGFDDTPGTRRAEFCWKGNQMFPGLDADLHFGYQLTGSLVVAHGPKEEEHLQELIKRGETNGVQNLRIVRGDELFKMEPHLNPEATAALFSPDAGTLIPYEYTIALAENAADNGVEVRIRREVESIDKTDDGLFSVKAKHWEPKSYLESSAEGLGNYYGGVGENGPTESHPELKVMRNKVSVPEMKVGGSGSRAANDGVVVGEEEVRAGKEEVKARYVVNAAGGFSDKISAMIGDDSFKVKPRLGEYVLLRKNQGHLCNHILFPCPGPLGKGILVQKTLWGNLILGPTARDVHEWPQGELKDPDSSEEVLGKILRACRHLVAGFDTNESIHSFSGARAKTDRGDWIIEPSPVDSDFIQAAGIDSPGIAGSPAIALEVVDLLRKAGLQTTPDASFNPKRAPIIRPKRGEEGLVFTDTKTEINSAGAAAEENVVCKCEKVTEAEVVEAMRRSLPVDSTQGMRKRTRAGMGGCQGKPWNYGCECRVAAVIAREAEEATAKVGRRPWSATSLFERRWLSDDDKATLQQVSQAVVGEVTPFQRIQSFLGVESKK